MTPVISIIIPCFNRIALLKETLKSVEVAINGLNAELILVDDGSEISIESQLQDFIHLPLKFIRQNNSGLTISRYNGLLAASGNYIQFLDSDDQIAPDKLTLQIEAMEESMADVSYTDVLQVYSYLGSGDAQQPSLGKVKNSSNPAEFYIDVQPAPHSPVFKKQYLVSTLQKAFIPLSREYDSIGEIWFYYNLAPFSAKIIKIDEPLTIIIHHSEERLTNFWERLGLCALSIQLSFSKSYPKKAPFSAEACTQVGRAAFNTFRGLPSDIYWPFQNAFIATWENLGRTSDLGGGKYFNFLSKILGYKSSALLLKRLSNKKYDLIRTIDQAELISKTNSILTNKG